jgi:nucleotide-binding universal stress UspA family protein
MIRSILVGLDGSRSATGLAIEWAKRFGAELTGVAVLDDLPDRDPGLYVTFSSYKVLAYMERLARLKADARRFVYEFEARCTAAGVRFSARVETGDPVDVLLAMHEDHDVTLLPKEPRFRFHTEDGPDDTLTEVLRRARRPVVAVPDALPTGEAVLVAYDSSPAAADALQSFAESGLGIGRPVTVVCADEDKCEASRRADEATRFLGYHDVRATVRPLATDTDDADTLAAAAEFVDAGLVVMGAFSRGRLREWFRPSVTARMLARPGRLLYLHHHPN